MTDQELERIYKAGLQQSFQVALRAVYDAGKPPPLPIAPPQFTPGPQMLADKPKKEARKWPLR